MTDPADDRPPITPDGRYIVVRGRLWRTANPHLDPALRQSLVTALMAARRAVKGALAAGDEAALRLARARVQQAKEALGERGPVWWDDGAPDLNRHMARNTPYAEWWANRSRD
jgi:ABC-type sugar transport system substrate-binding protein